MSYNLNRPSGAGIIWSFGAATGSYVAYFLLAAHYKDIAANIFLLVASCIFMFGAIMMAVNIAASKNE